MKIAILNMLNIFETFRLVQPWSFIFSRVLVLMYIVIWYDIRYQTCSKLVFNDAYCNLMYH